MASQRIGISLEVEMNVAPSEIGLRKRGLEHQRPVIGFQGIAVSLDVEIDIPAAEPGVRQVAAQLERRVVRSERLVMPLQLAEQIATIEMRLGISTSIARALSISARAASHRPRSDRTEPRSVNAGT